MNMADTRHVNEIALRGILRTNESMRRHTSWRVGGSVDRCYTPADLDDLSVFLRSVPTDEPVMFVGLGSNLLVRDGGFAGTVIFTHPALNALELIHIGDHQEVFVQTGAASPKVSRFAAMHGFEGGEFLTGIPGTIGGALAMNAGCYGNETWDVVTKVLTIDRSGEVRERGQHDYRIGYRSVVPVFENEEFFAGAWLRFSPGDGERSRRRIKALLRRRISTQPLEIPNAGSVFRNPPGDHAARLIEACGLKGLQHGGAMVSPKHANFIVNSGAASAGDIESLIEHVWKTVRDEHGVDLQREVRIVGEVNE
jgi:UDP-N-acetylmuramate dehydrogenase